MRLISSTQPSSTEERSATRRMRCDLPRLLRRLVLAALALTPALMLRNTVTPTWLAVLQILSCGLLAAIFFLRRRIPTSASVVVVVMCLYACGVGAIGKADPFTAIALGIALLFASSAFVILVETETMFTQAAADLKPAAVSNRVVIEGQRAPHDAPRNTRTAETVAYALAHDLRAPLRAIEGFTRALTEDLDGPLPPAAAHDLTQIQAGINRMHAMVAHWLTLIRNDAIGVARTRVNLSAMADAVIAELRAAEPNRSVNVVIAPGLVADGDGVLLQQLLQNLLGNAWKFTRDTPRPVLEVGSYKYESNTVYFVRDNGIGFDAEQAHRLFDPFARLHAQNGYEGSGIGLTIARNIVESHGGRIWAEGHCDIGTTIRFTLPSGASSAGSVRKQSWFDPNRSLFDFRKHD